MSFRLTAPSLCERKSVGVNLNEVSDVKPGLLCIPSNTGCKTKYLISSVHLQQHTLSPFLTAGPIVSPFPQPKKRQNASSFCPPSIISSFRQPRHEQTFSSEAFEPQTFFFLVKSPASHRKNFLPKGRVWICLAVASSKTFFQTVRFS